MLVGGGLLVNKYLQCTAHPEIFGGGRCIYLKDRPLDKVGVYAVRQNPILYQNLMASLEETVLQPFDPVGELTMNRHDVVFFRPYPFKVGEKLHIQGGVRNGDWEVIDVTDGKIKLRCPVSLREFEWNRFCYFVEARSGTVWPQE